MSIGKALVVLYLLKKFQELLGLTLKNPQCFRDDRKVGEYSSISLSLKT